MRTGLLLSLLLTVELSGEQRAQITGAIRDPSDAVLVGAAVTIVNTDSGVRRAIESDPDGLYAAASLAPGTYKITVRKDGFQTIARLNVSLRPAQNARIDFRMQVGSMRQVITIDDAPPLLNTDDGSVGLRAGRDLIERLPLNGRGVIALAALAPGVVVTPAAAGEAGQFSANGQRANANYFTVDGASANTSVSSGGLPAQFAGGALPAMTAFGGTQNMVTDEAIEEVRIQTSSFAPEFGRMPGAHVELTTRAGSNDFHGSLFYSLRNEKLNANDWFANRYALGTPSMRLNNWGGSLGGPLRHGKTFFFASYEGLRLIQPFTWVLAVPSDAARAGVMPSLRPLLDAFPRSNGPSLGAGLAEFTANASRPAQLDAGSLRVDHSLNPRHSLFARYNEAPSSASFGSLQLDRSQYRSGSFTAGVTSILPHDLNNDLRVNISHASVSSRWTPTGLGGAAPLDFSKLFPGVFPGSGVVYGFAIAGVGDIVSGDGGAGHQSQWNMVETFGAGHGAHAFRMGADYNRLTPARDRAAVNVAGRYLSLDDLLARRPMEITETQADQARGNIQTLSLFLQDTWRVHPRFTVTYGSRWELTPAPSDRMTTAPAASLPTSAYTASLQSPAPLTGKLWPTRYTQFAPRIGGAYRLSSHSVLRAGWGVFHDLSFSVATDPINGFAFNRWQFAAASPSAPIAVAGAVPAYTFAPGLKLPYSLEWNVAYENALTGADVLTVSFVGSSGRNLLRRDGTLEPGSHAVQQVTATNDGASRYNGLELQYRRAISRGIQGLVSYTWSHSIDNGSWDSGLYLVQPGIAPARDRGSSSFDIRHSLSAAFSWDLPSILRAWSLDGILQVRSGFPLDVLVNQNALGLGFDNITRPDLVPGQPLWMHGRLNPAAFAIPAGLQGNLGRDALTGFGSSGVDLSVRREFKLRNESVVQVRFDALNALNHPEFGDPVRYLSSPFFGQPVTMLNAMLGTGSPHSGLTPAFQTGGPRSLQISLRLRF